MKISEKIKNICDKAQASVYPKSNKEDGYLEWITVDICPTDYGEFQASLLKWKGGLCQGKLFAFVDAETLVDTLNQLEDHLDEYIDVNIRKLPQTIEHNGHTYILSK